MAVSKTTKVSKEKKEVDRSKPHLSIGIIGHIDAGKSPLAAAILKVQSKKGFASLEEYKKIDKIKEEKVRGITINIKQVKFETEKRHYTLIDCPGHVDFLKNMIVGASQMDGAILVISSDRGSQKQTIEHLKLCKILGVKNIVAFINDKTGIEKDQEAKEMLLWDVNVALQTCGYEPGNVPTIVFSALNALNDNEKESFNSQKLLSELIQLIDTLVGRFKLNYLPK